MNIVENKRWDLIKEKWDFELNRDPKTYQTNSLEEAYFICKNHKERFKKKIKYAISKEINCPYCTKPGQKILTGFNDLVTLYPNIAKEWDYKKNNYKPENCLGASFDKVWWICPIGHSYDSRVYDRVIRNFDCYYCSGRKVLTGFNDIFSKRADLKSEWDYEKNTVNPLKIGWGSIKEVYWICPKGHSYTMAPKSRTNTYNKLGIPRKPQDCPICASKRIVIGDNDFESWAKNNKPHLIEQWDYAKNTLKPSEVTPNSHKYAFWKCIKGHEWKANIKNRVTHVSGCPKCAIGKNYSRAELEIIEILKEKYPQYTINHSVKTVLKPKHKKYLELDIYIPELKFAIEYNGNYWHNKNAFMEDVKNNTYTTPERMKTKLCESENITLVHIWEDEWKKDKTLVLNKILNLIK